MFGIGDPDVVAVTEAQKEFRRYAAVLDAHLEGRRWLVDDRLRAPDFAVASELHAMRHPRFASISATPPVFDFGRAMAEKDRLIAEARRKNYREVLAGFDRVAWIDGRAAFASERVVRVGDRKIEGDQVLIATGCRTRIPLIEGLAEAGYLTNPEALALQRLPSSLVVLGGGPLGLEFAQIFARFGAKVTVVEARDRLLDFCDSEIVEALRYHLRELGVTFRFRETVTAVELYDSETVTHLESGKQILSDVVLYSAGRQGATQALPPPRPGPAAGGPGPLPADGRPRPCPL